MSTIRRGDNIWLRLDTGLILLYLLFVLMGWANIYSANYDQAHPMPYDLSKEYGKQLVWILIGLFTGAIVLLIEADFFRKFAPWFYVLMVLLLVAVLFFGESVRGSRSWFHLGGYAIQPSEFSKPATALFLASYLSRMGTVFRAPGTKLISALIIALPAALILLQSDTGTALIFSAFLLVLYREGLSGNFLLAFFLAVILGVLSLLMGATNTTLPFTDISIPGEYSLMIFLALIGALLHPLLQVFLPKRNRKRVSILLISILVGSILWVGIVDQAFNRILTDYQQERVHILLGLLEDPQGAGYNVEQSMTAIGSGGFMGKGYLEGTLTKYKYVPMQSTDFIFCTIGEEWGFLGSTLVIGLFIFFIIRITMVAERQRSAFTRIYGYGVACIFFMHMNINIGMAIGLAPVIGIPLPFFSYGGSSFLAFTILLFILLKLDAERLDVLR